MPSLRSVLMNPRRTPPPPVAVDLRRVMRVGTVLWALALVVTGVLALTGTISWYAAWVCGVGMLLGVAGAEWARRNPPPDPAASE